MNSSLAKLIRYFLKNQLLVNLLLAFIIIFAVAAAFRIQRSAMPRVNMHEFIITTEYPGASPADVELNVTRKIEEAIEEIEDIEYYKSESMENVSVIEVKINSGAEDFDEVEDNIRRAIDDISDLPEEVDESPRIWEHKSDNWHVFDIGMYHKKGDNKKLLTFVEKLRKELMELPMISGVRKVGVPDPEIKILLNKKAMERDQLSIEEVIRAISSNKIRLSAGSLESYTTAKGIVTFSEFATPEEIGNIIVRSNVEGMIVRLKSIAKIEMGLEELNSFVHINGNKGMSISLTKQGRADIIDAIDSVKMCIERFKRNNDMTDIEIVTIDDSSIETRIRLSILYSNAIAGLILVVVILFIFFNRRIAFWTAAGIPIAVGIALIGISFTNVTLNRISIIGLVVVLGMLVDDGIIVAETIHRKQEEGSDPDDAVVEGLISVVKPVIVAIFTTIIAFVPMYFIHGIEMEFAREIPTFVILMLVGSLIEALIILPSHLGHLKGKGKTQPKEPIGEGILKKIETWYVSILTIALKRKYLTFVVLIAFLVVSGGLSYFISNVTRFPIEQSYRMYIYGETKEGSSLPFTAREVEKIERIFKELPDGIVKSYKSMIGKKHFSSVNLSNLFDIELTLTPSVERTMSAMEVKNFIWQRLEKEEYKSIAKVDYYIDGGGPPAGRPVEIRVIGNDNGERLNIVKAMIKKLPDYGITSVGTDYREGKDEIKITPDYRTIAMAQLSVSNIAAVIRAAIDGKIAAHLDTAEEQIPFRVQMNPDSIDPADPLKGILVLNPLGNLVPIKKLVHTEQTKSQQTIYRYNGKRSNTVFGNIQKGITPDEIYNRLKNAYQDFERQNPGFRVAFAGEAEASSEMKIQMIIAICLAILAIYFILIVQFKSFLQPAMVILAIPYGLIGIALAFGIQRMDLSLLALIGIMGFTGVVVNDSLIMVDFINRIREENEGKKKKGKPKKDAPDEFIAAVIEGARLRLRPILLTTVTTVAGLIPTAYGIIGGFDSFVSPMVMAMAWGLIVGTPSVLIVIPVFYSIFHDFSEILKEKYLPGN